MQGYIEKFLNHHPESRIKYLASSSLLTVDYFLLPSVSYLFKIPNPKFYPVKFERYFTGAPIRNVKVLHPASCLFCGLSTDDCGLIS
jgi:hypothetical protein